MQRIAQARVTLRPPRVDLVRKHAAALHLRVFPATGRTRPALGLLRRGGSRRGRLARLAHIFRWSASA
ncbi:hypothetical protein JR064_19310 [Xanthomonas sp. CFBP 8703]|uniref:Uncharacterized protein n=1 Tax=Xanthomonas bonasiae TaxID=2810351 RepID=A0ABS3B747_9XANT|nr:hypothetical protein [Xanthomonas bonasiae]MBN6104316.1 hypothetical protein [Xanthomonas bonasiae]